MARRAMMPQPIKQAVVWGRRAARQPAQRCRARVCAVQRGAEAVEEICESAMTAKRVVVGARRELSRERVDRRWIEARVGRWGDVPHARPLARHPPSAVSTSFSTGAYGKANEPSRRRLPLVTPSPADARKRRRCR